MLGKIFANIISKNAGLRVKLQETVFTDLLNQEEAGLSFLKKLKQQMTPEQKQFLISEQPGPDHAKRKFVPSEEDKYKWIQEMNISVVLDVGAWRGNSARQFHTLFPEARIYSFEPLQDSFRELEALTSEIAQLSVFNCALGNHNGQLEMHQSEFTPSSSILKMTRLHQENFPFTAGGNKETVEVRTLDSMLPELGLSGVVLLKIDVQGYEEKVLKGATEALKQVSVIIVEVSFEELYAGQPGFHDVYTLLIRSGFEYIGSWRQLLSPKNGAVLQQNGIFIRDRKRGKESGKTL